MLGLLAVGRSEGIAGEICSMIVTDQIDAMRTLGSDPIRKLMARGSLATTSMLLFLTVIADAVRILGGAFIASALPAQSGSQYFHSQYTALHYSDVIQGPIKPFVFGFIISTCCYYYGMATRGGTQGVAAVIASTFIMVFRYLTQPPRAC